MKKSIIRFNEWTDFKIKFKEMLKLNISNETEMCQQMNIPFELYTKVINAAVNGWRESPSQSLFNGIAKTKLSIPKEGKYIFNNLLEQTRFLLLLGNYNIIPSTFFSVIKYQHKPVIIRGTKALTLSKNENAVQKFNLILQILFLYRYFTHIQLSGNKMPRKLYRGIRYSDVRGLNAFKEVFKNTDYENMDYKEKRVILINTITEYVNKHGFNELSKSMLSSFTSSLSVAKYFTKNEGFVVEIDTSNVDIFSSYLQDERFNVKDYYSNRMEKEFIISIDNKKIPVSNVIINDLDYFVAKNNPLAVPLFDHDNLSATYILNNTLIEVRFVWTSNTTHTLRYSNIREKSFSYGQNEFKERFGFSPAISNKNLNMIEDFNVKVSR